MFNYLNLALQIYAMLLFILVRFCRMIIIDPICKLLPFILRNMFSISWTLSKAKSIMAQMASFLINQPSGRAATQPSYLPWSSGDDFRLSLKPISAGDRGSIPRGRDFFLIFGFFFFPTMELDEFTFAIGHGVSVVVIHCLVPFKPNLGSHAGGARPRLIVPLPPCYMQR